MLDPETKLGFGVMRLSELEEAPALRLIHEALDRGVRFFDTADVYAPSADAIGHNERLLARALGRRREDIVIATKGGLRREGKRWIPDGRAKHLKAACEASLKALGVERLDVYQLHVLDPKVPLATSVRALASLQKQGKVGRVGLCNVRLEDVEAAREIIEVASVQVELNALTLTPLKNGVVDYCVREGIRLVAHSPLGGRRRTRRLAKLPVLRAVAERHGVSAHEIGLAWLRSIDASILPIPGATRVESLLSSLHALDVTLTDADLAELDLAFPAGRILRSPPAMIPAAVDADTDTDVVLFVGYPGAGKSTLAEPMAAQGYSRLNRDAHGGALADLLPELDRRLGEGERRIVLDNTYPRRESRFDVIETARRHGIAVRCVWLETTLEQAQVNAVRRMVARHGRLLEPAEMKASNDPNDFTPEAQFRYRRELEAPRLEEGFSSIDRAPFVPAGEKEVGKAIFVSEIDRVGMLAGYAADGFRIIQLTYQPGSRESSTRIDVGDVEVDVLACVHPPGPADCWCRKPLPGLGVVAIERFGLDPKRCIVVGDSAADRGFAERLGFRRIAPSELERDQR